MTEQHPDKIEMTDDRMPTMDLGMGGIPLVPGAPTVPVQLQGIPIRDQPPSGGCEQCGGTVRSRKTHPQHGDGWFCHRCVRDQAQA